MTTVNVQQYTVNTPTIIQSGTTILAQATTSPSSQAVAIGTVGSSGTLTLQGGSKLISNGRIGVGSIVGSGELDVLNGATATVTISPVKGYDSIYAGGDPGAAGLILVSGSGSLLDANGGELGASVPFASGTLSTSGTISINAGGTAQAGLLLIGYAGSSNTDVSSGTVTVDGVGSLLNVVGLGRIGIGVGTGTLFISNHAVANVGFQTNVEDQGLLIGILGGTGNVITDSGSTLTVYGRLNIGRTGSGQGLIEGGSTIQSVLSTLDIAANQFGVTIAQGIGGSGTLTATGVGSTFTTNGRIDVGQAGPGRLNVLDGAVVNTSSDMALGLASSSIGVSGSGQANLSGVGSSLSVGTTLFIGSASSGSLGAGTGSLIVAAGARAVIGGNALLAGNATLSVDSSSALEIGGGNTVTTGQLLVDATGTLGGVGRVIGTATNKGLIDATGGLLQFDTLVSTGAVNVETAGTLQAATLSGTVRLNGGTLRIASPSIFTGAIDPGLGGTIDLTGLVVSSASIVGSSLMLTANAIQYSISLSVPTASGAVAVSSDGGGGTNLSIACFAMGTRIRLLNVDVAVQDLNVGDWVLNHTGSEVPIIWIGSRAIRHMRRHPRPETVQPIRIQADAIAEGIPCRDLLLSPDHALFLGGHLIPVKKLINDASIAQLDVDQVTYYHIELANHDILLAENTPAESYLDTGDRNGFSNAATVVLHPEFGQRRREAEGYAPFAVDGPVVEQQRAAILERAGIETTDDPELHLEQTPDGIVICSRTAIPGHFSPDPRDCRVLGVKVAALYSGSRCISLDDPLLINGWEIVEPDGRWTNGAALVPNVLLLDGEPLHVILAATLKYRSVA